MKTYKLARLRYKQNIMASIAVQPQSTDEVTQQRIEEVAAALGVGCSLQTPRRFHGKLMSADDFQGIANHITIDIIAVVVNAVYKAEKEEGGIRNRVWYILGVLARF